MQYVYRKYGRDRAALAATLITYRPRSAVRDVGKALGLDLAQVDRLASVFAWWDGREVAAQRIREAGFAADNPVIERLVALTDELMGCPAPPVAARRRLRHRARPARADGAGRERGDAGSHGDPVGQGRPRRARPAQGRLPRARDALGDPPLPRDDLARARRAADDAGHSRRGSRGLRDVPARRHDRRVPDRVARAAVDAAAASARVLLRSRDRGGDRAARTDPGRDGASLPQAAAGEGACHVPERCGEERARAHARRADLPGAGDAARDRRRGLLARRGRPSAALDGGVAQERRAREVRAAAGRRHGRARAERGVRAADLPADPGLRRIRLSRIAFGVVRAPRLHLGVAQALPSGGVHGRAPQLAADGLLRAFAARAGRAAARRRRAAARRDGERLGLHARRRRVPRCASACERSPG